MKRFHALVFCVGAVIAGAAAAQECALPDVAAYGRPDTSDQQNLEIAAALAAYQLCTWDAFFKEPKRKRFPGDDAMMKSFQDAFRKNRDMFATRSSFPGVDVILQRAKMDHVMQKQMIDLSTYYHLSPMIYYAENCQTNDCTAKVILDETLAIGRDPYAEAAQIAREVRAVPAQPWFLLGDLTIKRASGDLTGQSLKAGFNDAVVAHHAQLVELARLRRALYDVLDTREEIMKPLEAGQRKLQNAISAVLAKHQADPKMVRASDAHLGLSRVIEQAERSMGRIDQAITLLVEQRPNTLAVQDRIRALQDKYEAFDARAELALQDREMLFAPDLPQYVADKVKILRRQNEDAKADLRRSNNIYGPGIERAEAKLHQAIAATEKTAKARNLARVALGKWSDNLRLQRVTGVRTKHAKLVEATEYELLRFQKHLDEVRRDVRTLRSKVHDLSDDRRAAKVVMLQAGNNANQANITLRNAGFISYIAQANLEVAFAAYDLAKSAELGPASFATEATKQFIMNAAFPPTYYDAARYALSEYSIGHDAPRSTEFVELDVQGMATLVPSADKLEKWFYGQPFKLVLKSLEESSKRVVLEAAEEKYLFAALDATPSQQANLAVFIYKQRKTLSEASKELAVMTGKAGKKAFAAHAASKFIDDLAKGIAKEVIKKGLAELIEGGQLEDYMLAQLELAQSVALFQHAGNLYWHNQDALVILEAMLDGLERRQAEIELLVDEKNAAFFITDGYRIELDISGDEDFDVSKLDGTLTLGGVVLKRNYQATTLVWQVPFGVVDQFDHDQPERLPLVLTIK
jgi:hypothetical protein